MNKLNTATISDFILRNNLKRIDGNILFDATVNFYHKGTLQTITSPVQVIMLIDEMALYILEFLKEAYHVTEMYNTGQYYFNCPNSKTMEIRKDSNTGSAYLISLHLL